METMVTVVGGGLAGCEAAWQLARRGIPVALVDGRPAAMPAAHRTALLAELVCSNSLRSDEATTPAGLLKAELRLAKSLILACADQHRVPAGKALAVDRLSFAREVTAQLARCSTVRIERRVVERIPAGLVIIASGPLCNGFFARELGALVDRTRLYFYDAIAPIVKAESIDCGCAFRQSRWDRAGGDYLNCPLDREQYYELVAALRAARKVSPHPFEAPRYFEGCLPIEVIADRGDDSLAFGPMRPVGLVDPRTGRRPFAVVQLRSESSSSTAYNLVGFQTRLAYPEQERVFRTIPALRRAEFVRLGSIHRNTYIDSPRLLGPELEVRTMPRVRFAGQITGVEGYVESCAIGLLAGLFACGQIAGRAILPPPATTALGALYQHIARTRQPDELFVPSNVNFGLMPSAPREVPKGERRKWLAARASKDFELWLAALGIVSPPSALVT
ncbi:MAG: methylenetetrahydrofolate--tRNA-(uracil(54)-C(5))-methyltransferase (FADH(2)-oxidizing) TrmFO [Pseudomonadota bacterium]